MSLPTDNLHVDELSQVLYAELKGLAGTLRRNHRVGDTMNTTALVGEAYLKLRRSSKWESRQHFMRVAAHAIRQVLVDEARYWLANKRKAAQAAVQLDEVTEPGEEASDAFLIALDGALQSLEQLSPRLAQLVEFRYFAGYTDEEIAEMLGLTQRTLRRDWVKVRAWLYQHLGEDISL